MRQARHPLFLWLNLATEPHVIIVMKKILIMGATSGIGLHAAIAFAEKGYMVGAAGRNTAQLALLSDRFPRNVVTRRIDVDDADAPMQLHDLVEEMEGMDIYFHVAGIGFENAALHELEETEVVKTNAVGFARMVCAAFRWFRDHNEGRGQIAAITSVAGANGIGAISAYSASKAFDQYYLRALDQIARMSRIRLRFTDIRPGWVRTPLLAADETYPMCMTLDYAVPRIVRAIEHRRRVAVIDWRWNLVVGLMRLVPNRLWVRLPIKISRLNRRK